MTGRLPRGRTAPLAAALLALAPAAAPGPLHRLGADAAWRHCSLAGETRPAATCPPLRALASHKGRRIPASGELLVPLAEPDPAAGPVMIDVEAYTYTAPPRDKITRLELKNLQPILSRSKENRTLERLLGRQAAFRPSPQVRGLLPTSFPHTVTLRFGPEERGRRVVFAVWAWPLTSARTVLDPVTPAEGERLRIAFGVRDRGTEADGPQVTFTVAAAAPDGIERALWRRTLDAAHVEADRGWQEAEVDLAAEAGHTLTLVLAAEPDGPAAAFPVWARPALVAPVAGPPPPSVLLLSFDTLRADHVGVYGYWRETTPSLDRLAAASVLFEQAVAPFPSTTASHMTMFTSLQPCAHGVLAPGMVLDPAIPTVAERLAAHGYATVAITEDGLIAGDAGFNRGFDSYRDLTGGENAPLGLFDRGIALARAWLERHGTEPFFMFLHTYQVHIPYKVPPRLRGLFPVDATASEARRQEADYDAGLRYADELFAGFLAFLESRGVIGHTVVVVTSDHGTEFDDHGGIGHARGVYEEQVRVPLLFHHPGLAAAHVHAQVGLLDLAPTFLDLAGAAMPASFAGRSLLPTLRGERPATEDPAVFAEQLWGPRQTLLRTDRYAWIQKPGGLELYELAKDPGEHRDLAREAPERAAEGARRIEKFRTACAARAQGLRSGTPGKAPLDPERERALRALGYLQ